MSSLFDVLFANQDDFERVIRSKVLSAEAFAHLFHISVSDVIAVVEFEPALAIKVTIKRFVRLVHSARQMSMAPNSMHRC